MQHLEVSGAVRHIYVIRRLKVKKWDWEVLPGLIWLTIGTGGGLL